MESDLHDVDDDDDNESHDASNFMCSTCEVDCKNETTFTRHLQGKKHKRKALTTQQLPSTSETVQALGSLSLQQLEGPTPVHEDAAQSILNESSSSTNSKSSTLRGDPQEAISLNIRVQQQVPSSTVTTEFKCFTCDATLRDSHQYEIHLGSKNHIKLTKAARRGASAVLHLLSFHLDTRGGLPTPTQLRQHLQRSHTTPANEQILSSCLPQTHQNQIQSLLTYRNSLLSSQLDSRTIGEWNDFLEAVRTSATDILPFEDDFLFNQLSNIPSGNVDSSSIKQEISFGNANRSSIKEDTQGKHSAFAVNSHMEDSTDDHSSDDHSAEGSYGDDYEY